MEAAIGKLWCGIGCVAAAVAAAVRLFGNVLGVMFGTIWCVFKREYGGPLDLEVFNQLFVEASQKLDEFCRRPDASRIEILSTSLRLFLRAQCVSGEFGPMVHRITESITEVIVHGQSCSDWPFSSDSNLADALNFKNTVNSMLVGLKLGYFPGLAA